ncbi:APC family permease [Parvibacter caecicola]|uniref:APC family permease n=1 Tax=Parvibacter caecicola TaxID=747645 RepID=A0A3N0A8G5_9ACTN|nr:APC family permease [Parvibacter caecicola]MBB3172151.1 amino acid transporter [Parvibacter caecicola]MCR2041945.1 APC family permease [Parvibacter caecicola]RNL09628.1 amino acid permease [Parvibacter caecicola]TJW11393.1 APC family permease [Parvibacter caecicola]
MADKAPIQEPTIGLGEDIEAFGYKQELKRGLQLRDVILYGVLFMVIIAPQSIYGEIQQNSHGMTPLVYIVGFIAISFTALSYMWMSKKFPIAGSVYSYVQRGINPHVGFIAGWLILLDYVFVPALLLVMVANWGVALVPGSPWYLWVVVFVVFNTFVNVRGISMSKGIDWIIFVVEILAVIAFIAIGTSFVLGGGGYGELSTEPLWKAGEVDAHFIAMAVSIACLSFLGFDGMSTLAEETYQPEKNIGKGIIIALCIMVVVFVAQTYVAALIQPDWENISIETGFFDAAEAAGGVVLRNILLVVNIVAVGIANIMNAQTASARLLYSMGRDGVIPRFFGKVHPKYQTPWVAALVLGGLSLIVTAFFGDMVMLSRFVNFGALSSFVLLNFAVFLYFFVKEKQRNSFADYMKYLICPFIGIFILGYVFTGFDVPTYVVGIVWLVIGLVIGAVKSKGYKEVPEAFKNLEV